MNKILAKFLPEAVTRHLGYETDGERMDRLVTESIMSGPSKKYADKEWSALESRLLKKIDAVNNQ